MLTNYEDHIQKAVTICQGVALGHDAQNIREEPKFSLLSLLVIADPAPAFPKILYHNQSSPTAFPTIKALESECETVVNRMAYITMTIIGTIFVAIYIVVAFSIKRVGKKAVFCEYILLKSQTNKRTLQLNTFFAAIWIFINATSTFVATWTKSFYVNMFFLMFLLSGASCGSCISAISADLFPTHFK